MTVKKLIIWCLLFAGGAAIFLSCQTSPTTKDLMQPYARYEKAPQVRILIQEFAYSVKLEIPGGFTLWDRGGEEAFQKHSGDWSGRVQVDPKGMGLGNLAVDRRRFLVQPNQGHFILEGQTYQGSLELIRGKVKRFSTINHVDLETYTAGVVMGEMPTSWSPEALKAQAIASRSYALYQMRHRRKGKSTDYDLRADVRSQVYHGRARKKILQLVKQTQGMVVSYSWKMFPTFFHSTCGGTTAPVAQVFDTVNVYPLAGVKCQYCGRSKYHQWKKKFTLEEIERACAKADLKVGRLAAIEVEANRVRLLGQGRVATVDRDKFREIVGRQQVLSNHFSLVVEGETVHVEGHGYGHRVGMCQYGAQGMAKKGFLHSDILEWYYPGSRLVKVY